MRTFILAAVAVASLGMGVANAASSQSGQSQQTQQSQVHRPNSYNWMAGGGG